MKVFLSWSGPTSHTIAKILRDWLPSVIQSIEPYVSSEDIDKGARWSSDIAGELDSSSYGIICLTPDNVNAPWINFEAGALGKSVDKSRVSPVLFRLKKSELKGPLVQFQATVFEKDDVLKLMQSVNSALPEHSLDPVRLEKAFATWWPELESQLNGIANAPTEPEPQHKLIPDEISSVLEELIDLTRANHKLLREPGALIHPRLVEEFYMRSHEMEQVMKDAWHAYNKVRDFMAEHREELLGTPMYAKLDSLIKDLQGPLHHGARRRNPKDWKP
ncbi:TIR domain-containing protein [Pseudomonas sp. 273]|uniref:toll/interleukin-1 receptor domain-containing protein n=1 Tax=Pseudomonas sp. 273 TaxID=75692 RepID=UPI0023D8B161|nr:TIR domain-containing protein [Pseudomonas sp. 273]